MRERDKFFYILYFKLMINYSFVALPVCSVFSVQKTLLRFFHWQSVDIALESTPHWSIRSMYWSIIPCPIKWAKEFKEHIYNEYKSCTFTFYFEETHIITFRNSSDDSRLISIIIQTEVIIQIKRLFQMRSCNIWSSLKGINIYFYLTN